MERLFIPAKSTKSILPVLEKVKIDGRIGLISTAQYADQLSKAQTRFGESIIGGQILGCDASAARRIADKVDAFLYIGEGKFHPIAVALAVSKPVYIADLLLGEVRLLSEDEIEEYLKHQKSALMHFYRAQRVGVLISLKPGQYHPKQYLTLQGKLKILEALKRKFKDKQFYILLFDTLSFNELENFPPIECFVNTACPRLMDDYKKFNKPVVNFEDVIR